MRNKYIYKIGHIFDDGTRDGEKENEGRGVESRLRKLLGNIN
jgi:hypothetical protein